MENEIKYIEQRSQAIAKYSDKLRQSIKEIDTEMTPFFKAAGVNVFDDVFEYEDECNIYTLGICKAEHGIHAGQWGIFLEGTNCAEMFLGHASRAAIVMAVTRIIPLLEKYSKVLEMKELEFKRIAEDAEKMAESIRKV